jgi:hypothetical protein
VIRGAEEQEYFFLHLTMQEFLAASCLARILNGSQGWETTIEFAGKRRTVREWVDKKAWDPVWRGVICLLTGRLNDAGPLLEMLSNRKPTATNPSGDDVFQHRLALAAQCLAEIPKPVQLSRSPWINAITTEVFAVW